jgi:hypothetical protein
MLPFLLFCSKSLMALKISFGVKFYIIHRYFYKNFGANFLYNNILPTVSLLPCSPAEQGTNIIINKKPILYLCNNPICIFLGWSN